MTNQYSYAETFAKTKVEAPKKKIAESNISSAAKVYMLSRTQEDGTVSGYRHGNNNGQKYMTGEDFVTYFQKRGRVETKPENVAKRTVSTSEVYRSRPTEEARTTGNVTRPQPKASYGAPNVSETIKIYRPEANKKIVKPDVKATAVDDDDVKIYVPKTSQSVGGSDTVRFNAVKTDTETTAAFSKVGAVSKIKKAAGEWLPEDEIVKAKNKKKSSRRPFSKMILAIVGTAVSLMLIVGGSVLMSGANRDVKSLERELNQLKATENELELELEMKNDVNVLRTRATDELGMIRKEYVEASYLDTRGSDVIVAHEQPDEENVGIAAILSAFGLAD